MTANEKFPAGETASFAQVQGEGDYDSARRFNKDEASFLKSANVPELARQAAPKSKAEAEELQKAEEIGRSHRANAKEPGSQVSPGDTQPAGRHS